MEKELNKIKLNGGQAVAYAVVATHYLMKSPNKIDEKEVYEEMITVMKLHPKEDIISIANKIIKKIKQVRSK